MAARDAGAPRRPGIFRRLRWLWIGVVAFVGIWLAAIGGNSLGRYFGWTVRADDPAALAAMLRPYYRIVKPEGAGPFPTALLYSGCDGPADNMDRWAQMLVGIGWAAVIVDSHTPRGYLDHDVWRLICAGQILMGSERAGDVLVSFYDARRMSFVDPDRLALIGASHGGWAILELLAFEKAWRLPYNLTALPRDDVARDHPLEGLRAAILIYPYCGTANRARHTGWRYEVPVLFLLAERDSIAPADDCVATADEMAAEGLPVDVETYAGVTHGFDQQTRKPLSLLEFDQAATDAALARAAAFLEAAAR